MSQGLRRGRRRPLLVCHPPCFAPPVARATNRNCHHACGGRLTTLSKLWMRFPQSRLLSRPRSRSSPWGVDPRTVVLAVSFDKETPEDSRLNRLLESGNMSILAVDAIGAVASDEYKGNIPESQRRGHRINRLATHVDVENAAAEMILLCRGKRLSHIRDRPDDGKAEIAERILHHDPNDHLVFDE